MTRHWWHPALALALAALAASLLAGGRFPGWGWEEVQDGPEWSRRNDHSWTYRTRLVPLVGPSDELTVGCGGGSNTYCTYTVVHEGSLVLRFAGNCDGLWAPRMWLEPLVEGRPRRVLTWHERLVNDSLGEALPGGYWLWTWDGERYRPSPP